MKPGKWGVCEPDYWEKLEHQYAGQALQARIIADRIRLLQPAMVGPGDSSTYAAEAAEDARALIARLKGERGGGMMDKYLGWRSLEEVKRSFFGDDEPDDFPSDDEIVVAWYDTEFYSGRAFVLFKRGGKLFEVNAWHCSCNDLEGQWRPEKTSVASMKMRRPTAFPFCDEYDDLYEEFVELLDSLAKAREEG